MGRARCAWFGCVLLACATLQADEKVLFDFTAPDSASHWKAHRLPQLVAPEPEPSVEHVPASATNPASLKITFAGGVWPTVATTTIPVTGNWKEFQSIRLDLTVDRPCVAYLRIHQTKVNERNELAHWETTLMLQKGRNEVARTIRRGLGRTVLDPGNGDVTQFIIGMYRPDSGQTLNVGPVRLSTDWPDPRETGWYSPHNHDGYSVAVAREYQRTGKLTRFRVLGTDREVADLPELAAQLKDQWKVPEPATIAQIETAFRLEYERLKRSHPRARLLVLRDGERGWNESNPEQAYSGWKMVYVNCHGPDGPNGGREKTPELGETVESFMRHRGVLMQADFSMIPTRAKILASRFVVTRAVANDLKPADKPNMWVVEPCHRDWDPTAANCYFYATQKQWKAVSGLHYGEDPDFWPVFAAHGPSGGGPISSWDFTAAMKFWVEEGHINHGFFLHGLNDYARIYTQRAKEIDKRPALLVVYEPS